MAKASDWKPAEAGKKTLTLSFTPRLKPGAKNESRLKPAAAAMLVLRIEKHSYCDY
jgi:hypothetical protein